MTAAAMVFLVASWAIAFGALVPSLYFFIQVLSARRGAARARAPHAADGAPQVRLAVLIPAHNEAAEIASTVRDLRTQIGPHDRLLVVADNCVDETAELARAAGAEAAERFDASLRGKGFALAYGVQALAAAGDPPDIVVMVDADCRLLPGTVRRLANAVVAWGAPVQASFLVLPPDPVSTADRAAAFAWRIKNLIRPLGSAAWGLPCLLTGSGMAFRWRDLALADLATGDIVEDMQIGLNLALHGRYPRFCVDAEVRSWLAHVPSARASQSRRWIHGHLGVLFSRAPRLLAVSFLRRDLRLLGLALEVAVPPLVMLVTLGLAAVAVAALAVVLGFGAYTLMVAIAALTFACAGIAVSWWQFGRDLISAVELIKLPLFAIRRFPLYLGFFLRRETRWVRTDRE